MVRKQSICLNCNKEFIYETNRSQGKYCTKKCWDIASKNYFKGKSRNKGIPRPRLKITFKVICGICGKIKYLPRVLSKRFKTCSKECQNKYFSKLWKEDNYNGCGFKKGRQTWNKGIPRTEEEKQLMSKRKKEMMTQEIRDKISKSRKGKKILAITGELHPNWKGGKSFELYSKNFDEELKEQIRKRDNYTCQECNYTQEQLGYKLSIHHIDYNKKNNNPENLISLCKSCHGKTGYNRNDWVNYYKEKVIT